MPSLSGVPIPTPIDSNKLRTSSGIAFLVSQQWDFDDPHGPTSDNIRGYAGAATVIWMVNKIFASSTR